MRVPGIGRTVVALVLVGGLCILYREGRPPSQDELRTHIRQGLDYLSRVKSEKSVFDDPLLSYVYGGEDLPGPQIEFAPLTYRKIDAFLKLVFLREALGDVGPLTDWTSRAERQLRVLTKSWGKAEIEYNFHEDARANPAVALDTYCMVGDWNRDRKMAENVLKKLKNGRWLPPHFFNPGEGWRDVADESWCVLFLADMGLYDERVERALESELEEWDEFRRTESSDVVGRRNVMAILIHLEMLGNRLAERRVLSPPLASRFGAVERELLSSLEEPWVRRDAVFFSNALAVLLVSGQEKVRLRALAHVRRLLRQQQPNGMFGDASVTLRAVTALGLAARALKR
jgi:hypothetical protein